MGTYLCKSRDRSGALVERTLAASSEREALMTLEQSGLVPIRIHSVTKDGGHADQRVDLGDTLRKERLTTKQLQQLSMQLGSSLQAGVPILTALRTTGLQTSNEAMRAILAQLTEDIEGGLPLSAAMRRFPRAFPEVYVSTITAGERTGSIDELMFDLNEYLESEMELRSQLRSALLYPLIVGGTLCLAVSILVVFIVPRFAVFYTGMGAELPLPTKLLVTGSNLVSNHVGWLLGGLVALGFAWARFTRTGTGRSAVDRALLRIPVLGRMIESAITLRVVRMLGVTVNAGLPLLEGLELMETTTTNTKIKRDLRAVVGGIRQGESLAASMEAARCFPPPARQMLANGESTGSMGTACEALARQYQRELRTQTKDLTTLIEPLLTLCLAVIVLFVALAAFLPMWNMTKLAS